MSTKVGPFKKTNYFTEKDYKSYAKLLKVPESSFRQNLIGVSDINEEYDFTIIYFHYHSDLVDKLNEAKYNLSPSEILEIKSIRGVAVDPVKKIIICKGPTQTQICVRNSISTNGEFYYEPNELAISTKSISNTYKKWVYGALIRVFCYEGVVFVATNKKLSCANSFFGGSRKFKDILFEDQDIFRTPESMFQGKLKNGIIHLFLLNDETLAIDSVAPHEKNRIYYNCSYDMNDPENDITESMTKYIQEKNLELDSYGRPIYFSEEINVEDANAILGGNVYNYQYYENKHTFGEIFNPGERIFMINEYGIFGVFPEIAINRTNLMEGTSHVEKIFCDYMCIEPSNKAKGIIHDVGISYRQLKMVESKIIRGDFINFDHFEQIPTSYAEKVLTNLVFQCPKNKVSKCFEAYETFDTNIIKIYEYLRSIASELESYIKQKKLQEYPGFGTGLVQLKRYFISNFCACLTTKAYNDKKTAYDIIGTGPDFRWPESIKDLFNDNKKMNKGNKDKVYLMDNAILCFIMNSPGDVFYSLFNLEDKINKAKIAFAKRDSLKDDVVDDDIEA